MHLKHQNQTSKWINSEIKSFYKDYINPYIDILKQINAYDGIMRLLGLLDREGDCSSITKWFPSSKNKTAKPDLEADEWRSHQQEAYEILSKKVSLLEHTLNVAKGLIEDRKKESKDFVMEMGRLLFVSLGHDIGKIPSINCLNKGKDHFIISYEILNEILPLDYPSRDEILAAVRDHHYPNASSSNILLKLLKAADHQARQQELKKYGYQIVGLESDEKIKTPTPENSSDKYIPKYNPVDLSWLDVSRLLDLTSDRINVVKNGQYEAFSHSGIVYVFPVLLARLVCDFAIEAGRMNVLAYSANKEKMGDLMYAIRQLLNEHIPEDMVGPSFIGRRFQIVTKQGRALNPGFYIPLRSSAFANEPLLEDENQQNNTLFKSIQCVVIFRAKDKR